MTTRKNTKAAQAVALALASVANVAFLYQRGEQLAVDTLRASGATKEAAREFAIGYLAAKWSPSATALTDDVRRNAIATIDGASSTAKTMPKGSTVRRTARQDADMAACRKAWQRFLDANAIAKTETRGAKSAASAKAKRAPQMAGSSKQGVTETTAKMLNATETKPAVAKFKGVGEASDWLARASVQFRATHDANAKVLTLAMRDALLQAAKLFADAAKESEEARARGREAIDRIKAA